MCTHTRKKISIHRINLCQVNGSGDHKNARPTTDMSAETWRIRLCMCRVEKNTIKISPYLCAHLVFCAIQINRLISAEHQNIVRKFRVLISMFGVLFMIFAVLAFNKNGDYYHVSIVCGTPFFLSLCVLVSTQRFGLVAVVYACVHFDRFNQINNNPMHSLKTLWAERYMPFFFRCPYFVVASHPQKKRYVFILRSVHPMAIFDYVQCRFHMRTSRISMDDCGHFYY